MSAASVTSQSAACPLCGQRALRRFRCRACATPRNRGFRLAMSRWWTAALLVGFAALACAVIFVALRERDREQRIDAREAQLSEVRAEQRELRERIAAVEARAAQRSKAAADLERQAPRLRKQLATATSEAAVLQQERAQLQAAISSGVLPPGVQP